MRPERIHRLDEPGDRSARRGTARDEAADRVVVSSSMAVGKIGDLPDSPGAMAHSLGGLRFRLGIACMAKLHEGQDDAVEEGTDTQKERATADTDA